MNKVGLIGYGYWGKNLARVFGKDLVGICDYNQDNLDNILKKTEKHSPFSSQDIPNNHIKMKFNKK